MPLRIGLVCKSLRTERGGHEKYWDRLLRRMLERDVEVVAFSRQFDPDHHDLEGLDCVRVPTIRWESTLRVWSFNRNARRAVARRRDRLDLVLTTGKVNFGDVYRAGGGLHTSFLEHCAGWTERLKPKHWVRSWLQRSLFTHHTPRSIITNSRMVRDEILRTFSVPEDRLNVVYNGVDTDRFHPRQRHHRERIRRSLDLQPDDYVCLFTGGGWKRKGLPNTLRALAAVPDPRVKEVVIGHVARDRLRALAARLGVEDRVRIVGYVEEVERYYAMADVLLFPSRYDPGASVVIEALATGCPVISTRTTGTSELISPGENGVVLRDADDVEAMAEALRSLRCMDPDSLRRRARETGRKYTMERNLSGILGVLESTARRSATVPP